MDERPIRRVVACASSLSVLLSVNPLDGLNV